MKRRYKILLIILVLVLLYISDFLGYQPFPESAADSVVQIGIYSENASIATGSGFVISKTGTKTMIATCAHVVEDEKLDRILVFIDGEWPIKAEIVCADEEADLAIISIDTDIDLQPLPLAYVGLGSRVFAIGYSTELTEKNVVYKDETSGKSASSGRVTVITGGIFDAPLRIFHSAEETYGESGGPLVNQKGEVVGVIAFGQTEPIVAYGSASTRDLQKLCDEVGIEYTHHLCTRLLKDAVASVLIIILIYNILCAIPERKEKTT